MIPSLEQARRERIEIQREYMQKATDQRKNRSIELG